MSQSYTARIRLGLGAAALTAPLAGMFGSARAQPRREAPALKDVYSDHFKIGAAISPNVLAREGNGELLARHFNSITGTNDMKPNFLTDENGVYRWERADMLVNFAQAHAMEVRGHTLLWHHKSGAYNAAPDWFFEGGEARVIRRRLETYIHNVVSHFRGKIFAWDVVNEVASDNVGEIYRAGTSPWHQALGPDYIEWAFRAAHAADPDCLLFINDYDSEEPGKLARLMHIVDDLQRKGAPIHGVGHQLHMNYSHSIEGAEAAIVATEERGLINHITELDVSVYADPGSCFSAREGCEADFAAAENVPRERTEGQARLYGDLFDMFARHPSVTSVTTWGLRDDDSWLDYFPTRRTNAPLLFDRQGRPKDAFWNIVRPRAAGS
jgi:endo-1,4-beta-xylanase